MIGKQLNEIPVVFYRSSRGNEPVRDWLRGLPVEDRRKIGVDLATVQVGWPVGMRPCAVRLAGNCGRLGVLSRPIV